MFKTAEAFLPSSKEVSAKNQLPKMKKKRPTKNHITIYARRRAIKKEKIPMRAPAKTSRGKCAPIYTLP